MRSFIAISASLALLTACGGETPPAPAEPTPPVEAPAAAAPDPTALPTPAQADVQGMNLMCGGSQMKVAFEATRAVITNDDGTTTELPVGPVDAATTEPGATIYTDGKISFAKSGGGDTATVVRFARGRMAWQDCAIAMN